MWKFVPNAILFTPVSRKLPRLADVLINSTRNTVLEKTNKRIIHGLGSWSQPFYVFKYKTVEVPERFDGIFRRKEQI